MYCELIGNILHVKSEAFVDTRIVNVLSENFMKILSNYLQEFKVSSVQMLIRDWDKLKVNFEAFLNVSLLEYLALDILF